ncbi:hypothetical protein [Victivallis sp. Marseille-Q1083]|uniref:hypothetical protein n=1 Tax=Victivallis sp. Marseille-Q1083 TaxID=2717288 RepID=UPI00158B244B|nr:hypothetical protein [Victivallis sp. Marseille-Q1083]
MNIQARTIQSRKSRPRGGAKGSLAVKLWMLFNVILLLGAAFVIVNYRIALNQKIADVQKETTALQNKLHTTDREIEALRIKREKLTSWDQIRARITAYQLPLIQPEPHQVQQLVLRNPTPYTPEPQILFPSQPQNRYAVVE